MFKKIKNFYEKRKIKSAIKDFMQEHGLRTISFANYRKWMGESMTCGVHSVKININDGNVVLCPYKDNGKCGEAFDYSESRTYKSAYNTIMEIMSKEKSIPSVHKRNILVKVSR